MGLTPRQAEILAFVTSYAEERGFAPTLQEIGDRFGLSSVATVHKHVRHLVDKGYLKRERRNASRDIEVVEDGGSGMALIPLLGTVAAGRPIEALAEQEQLRVPEEWLGKGRTFALRVRGDSMIDEQIRNGDTVVVEARETARNGETVIALVDGESVTVKQYYRDGAQIRLQPANPAYPVMVFPEERVAVQGVVIGVLRRYN
ncbi:MAG: transcriptional repressor LexA [bacterium]|jgi:repressor LexA|nr:transcriptional repressor LexA [bacterium]MBK7187930.1 transcriptional repressor LexA [bacterium]MBK7671506.1 transcriptional repressor LexA [bacterium]MBK7772093.1 transcriptional repressor LexA [bacterium]MBK9473483.1 transcriptional repressor LexA [bacterium]